MGVQQEAKAGEPKAKKEKEPRPCKCPTRSTPPEPPAELPFPATPENVPRLREFITARYGSSAFNT